MTEQIQIPQGVPRVRYIGTGSQTEFTYPFPIFETADLEVYLGAALQATGFAVDGAGATAGGSVFFATAPANGTTVTLTRRVPIERVSDFLESGPLPASSLNAEFDRLTACLQQVAGDQEAMLRYPETDLPASAELPGRTIRANRLLAFDTDGNPTASLPDNTDAQIGFLPGGAGATARPVRDKLADLVSIKDFGAIGDGVVDDTVAIQAALTAHDAVLVPAGRYRITNTITVGYGQALAGLGSASILQADGDAFDAIRLPDGYATVKALRIENGLAGIRLFGGTGPCVQNALVDLVLWQPTYGIVLDGYTQTARPCYWNNIVRVLVARPSVHGVWLTKSGAGDSPNANKFQGVRVYSLSAPISGSGFFVEHGKYNNAFVDCEANLSTDAVACFRLGPDTDKNLIVNLACETLGGVPNVQIDAGSVETSIINLFSASAGPAIHDLSGGQYTAVNAGYPTKNRLTATRITDLTVEALRYDTEFIDLPAGGLFQPDLSSSVYLVSGYNGAVEVRLPAAGDANGHAVTIKKTDATAHPITITEAGGAGPDGRAVALGNRYDFITVVSNGAAWWISAGNVLPGNASYFEGGSLFQPDLTQSLYLVSAYGGAVECRLPSPSAAHAVGRTVSIKKSDSSGNAVTVTAASGTGPDNEAIPLTAYGHAVTVMSNGGAWYILGRNP
ncbi:MAG: hypothetical protein GC191_05750 [Azospirillum sp.]|nr:hypothetical protein [Azospirillum sp.]